MGDFDPEGFASALKYYVPDSVKLEKEGAELFQSMFCEINTKFVDAVRSNSEKLQVIDAKTVQNSIEPLIPENLRRYAFANASKDVFLYSSEVLAHGEQFIGGEPVTVDYRMNIKRILHDFDATAARGFLPHINGYLNDLCYVLAEKSSENAKNSNGVLTENDVLYAVNEVLPQDLREHAFARISYLQGKLVLAPTQTSEGQHSPVVENLKGDDQDESTEPVHDKSFSIVDFICPVSYEGEDEENEALETDQIEKGSSASYLDLEKEMFYPAEGNEQTEKRAEIENIDEANRKESRRSLFDIALQWFSPTGQNQENEIEQAESDNNES